MAIFSSSVMRATSSRARCSGEMAVFIQGRSVDALRGTAVAVSGEEDASAGPARDASASAKTLTALTVLTFIGAPFYDGLRRERAAGSHRSAAAEQGRDRTGTETLGTGVPAAPEAPHIEA